MSSRVVTKDFRESDMLAVEYVESQSRWYLGIITPEILRLRWMSKKTNKKSL
jgi:hypothetical protein